MPTALRTIYARSAGDRIREQRSTRKAVRVRVKHPIIVRRSVARATNQAANAFGRQARTPIHNKLPFSFSNGVVR